MRLHWSHWASSAFARQSLYLQTKLSSYQTWWSTLGITLLQYTSWNQPPGVGTTPLGPGAVDWQNVPVNCQHLVEVGPPALDRIWIVFLVGTTLLVPYWWLMHFINMELSNSIWTGWSNHAETTKSEFGRCWLEEQTPPLTKSPALTRWPKLSPSSKGWHLS